MTKRHRDTRRPSRTPTRTPPRAPSRRPAKRTLPSLALGRHALAKIVMAGRVKPPRVTSAALLNLRPEGTTVATQSGAVNRGALLRSIPSGLPGFSWEVPAPDANRQLLWVQIGFDWHFNGWKSEWPKNTGSSDKRVEGSLRWLWYLTGHPQLFPDAPILLSDSDGFDFYTSIPPGGRGWDVGWLAPAKEGVFTNVPDKQDEQNTSPLQRLLSLKQGNTLKLWHALDIRDKTPVSGVIWPWGPKTLFYVYAYVAMASPVVGEEWEVG